MVALALSIPSPDMHSAPLPAAAYAHHGPTVAGQASPDTPQPVPSERKARRLCLLIARARALGLIGPATRHAPADFEPFTPAPRASVVGAREAEPLLSPAERARLAVDVAIARDGMEWQIGRAEPCRWLVLAGAAGERGIAS